MRDFFRFLFSKRFLINVGLAIALIAVLIWLSLWLLKVYTNHGESLTVPDFSGLKMEQLDEFAAEYNLNYVIIDSIFELNKEKGTIVGQDPLPESQVKEGRKVYLTIISTLPEMKRVPNLVDASIRQAISILETYGLGVGKITHKPSDCVNCVIDVRYKGRSIQPGHQLERGSKIDLVLGGGKSGEVTTLPYLIDLTYKQAYDQILAKSLNVGAIVECFGCKTWEDTNSAFVYKQDPVYYSNRMINLGKSVDLYLTTDLNNIPVNYPDSLENLNDTLKATTDTKIKDR